ncbi:uncharacterized protein [Haliotis asinina]|uniref:uncharacterized protein n=1 Tax=Haliotis asinina TaxID=109174 RepID=UPI0035319E22
MRSTLCLLVFGSALLLSVSVADNSKCLDSGVEGQSTDDGFPELLSEWCDKVDDDDDNDDDNCDVGDGIQKRSADYGYNVPNIFGGYGPNVLASRGSYGGYSKSYGGGFNRFQSTYDVPKPVYQKSFHEGKWELDNKHMIKNYYKKGTYQVAKKYFIALPFVKIIPVKTTTSVDYVGYLQTYDGYKVRLCEHCNNGHPQIEFQSLSRPHRNVIRRFKFLPNTKRSRTEYGQAKIVQTGPGQVSNGNSYGGSYGRLDGFGLH